MKTDREPMSVMDAAWLRMDRPTNLMMICGMLMFSESLDLDKVRDVIRRRMLRFHRFAQRAVRASTPYWEADPQFELSWHVRRIGASGGNGLEEVVSDLISTPLDSNKPMWQFHLIDIENGGSALLMRIHHCYGDGFALMHILGAITDTAPDKPRLPGADVRSSSDRRSAIERILGPVPELLGDAVRSAGAIAGTGLDLLARPSHVLDYGKTAFQLARDFGVIAGMPPDSPTRFKGPLLGMKRAAWARPISLFEVKAIAAAFSCSVNDVLLSCVAGALRSYLMRQGDPVDSIEMRALVPVNQRPPGPITELGNRFGMVFVPLPLGIADAFERLMEMHRRMQELKRSQQSLISMGILAAMGVLPEELKERVLETLAANASAVITNVHGSEEARYLAEKRINRQVFWVPQSGGICMGISILSYAGNVDFGVVTDVERVPDPATLVGSFVEEFETMLLRALLMPWPRETAAPQSPRMPPPAKRSTSTRVFHDRSR